MQKQDTFPSGKPYTPIDSVPVPGQSLTRPKGEYNWEQPPQHTNPDSAIAEIMDKISTPQGMGRMFALLENGITVVTMVDAMVLSGFAQGKFNPNVAELIKPDLREFIMLLADKAEIKYKKGVVKPKGNFDKTLEELQDKKGEVEEMMNPKEPADISDEEPIEDSDEEPKGLMIRARPISLMERGDM
tara:strand:+ start:1358 stop:1918 length:561 start_codon:yes stop_codon:yes gene_type:complete